MIYLDFHSYIIIGSFPVYSSHSVGNMLGGEIVIITGPTFEEDDDILCIFGQIETEGVYLSGDKCLCVVPTADEDNIVNLAIKITRGSAVLTGGTKFRYSKLLLIDHCRTNVALL